MNRKLEIFGPYPPPLGGISIHIQRLEFFLKRAGIEYLIYNHGSFSSEKIVATNKSILWYFKYLLQSKNRLIHFHQFFGFHYFYFFVFSLVSKTKIIVTIHEENLLVYNIIFQRVILFFLRCTKFAELISVSQKLSDFLIRNRIKNTCLPAYVPPKDFKFKVINKIPGKDYFLYSIWKLDRNIAERVYNIELALQLLRAIKGKYHMLFMIGTEKDSDKGYLSHLLSKYDIGGCVTVFYETQLTDYVKNCKFLLRTNSLDGYGVSLQEAMDLHVPAIASDVCSRPKGTILFKNNNFDDLYEKVIHVEKYWRAKDVESPNYHESLILLYKKHLKCAD